VPARRAQSPGEVALTEAARGVAVTPSRKGCAGLGPVHPVSPSGRSGSDGGDAKRRRHAEPGRVCRSRPGTPGQPFMAEWLGRRRRGASPSRRARKGVPGFARYTRNPLWRSGSDGGDAKRRRHAEPERVCRALPGTPVILHGGVARTKGTRSVAVTPSRRGCAGLGPVHPVTRRRRSQAGGGTRTHDPRFTRALLYQLSYSGRRRHGTRVSGGTRFGDSGIADESCTFHMLDV
jgi:hypothetical protein